MFKVFNVFRRAKLRVGGAYARSASVVSFNHDGLEIARVRNERRWLPLWHIAVFIYLALLIRLVTIAEIGPAAYANRMENMNNGSMLERAAASIMYMDPVSRNIAVGLRNGMSNLGLR